MDLELSGRTALVTGATTGIGRGIAEVLAAEGVRLVISGRRTDALAAVADAIGAKGATRPHVIAADITNGAAVSQLAREALVMNGGRIDILVNNAGASRPLADMADEAAWDESLALNFASARQLANALVPAMKEARFGRIVNLTGAMVAPSPNAAAPAKSALNSWSRSMAITLAPHGITVNAIAPGRINSEQIATRLHPTEASRAEYIQKFIPAGHFGEPEDIAHLVAFLASPRARYINGAAIPVDGAMLRIA
ncbi:MAG: SDR family NAD(P)-dependent oxidoreductase [Hyphomicrobiaceae bacterium]